jgi:hypothetical protein
MIKQTLKLLTLSALMLLPTSALKADQFGDFTYTSDGTNVTITGYTGSNPTAAIPDRINYLPVTSIGNFAFQDRFGLTSVSIPDGVTNIGWGAFNDCSSLTNVMFGNGVTSIGEFAFGYCLNLKAINVGSNNPAFSSVVGILFNQNQTMLVQYPVGLAGSYIIPNSVTNIKSEAFWNCSLTNITFGTNVVTIGMSAFNNCYKLLNLTIPNSVTSIGESSFYGCESLTNIIIGNSVANIGDYAFSWCTGLLSLTIPNSVTNIGEEAFSECTSMTSVTLGNSVTNVGYAAFLDCLDLTSVTIGNSVTDIGGYAFGNDINLTSVFCEGNAPINVETNTFSAVQNATVYYLAGTSGWDSTFAGFPTVQCTTNNNGFTIVRYNGTNSVVTIPSAINNLPVTIIGTGAFLNCTNLTSITLGNSITNIGEDTFYNCCNLANVLFEGDAPTNVGTDVFYGDVGVTIYYLAEMVGWSTTFDGWPTIPSDLLYTSSNGIVTITGYTGSAGTVTILTNINGQPVTGIGENTFYACSLTGVIIPDSVTNIGAAAFKYCSSLTAITVDAQNPAYNSMAGVLFNKDQTTLIQYPGGKAGSYTIPSSVSCIGDDAFAYCFNLSGVTIGNAVTNIGKDAFNNCVGLISATLPDSVISIADGTFESCISLTNLTIGAGVTSIGNFAFFNCQSLSSFTVGNSVTNIGEEAFYNCISLTNVTMGGSITSIGEEFFGYCTGLISITIPNTVTNIEEYAFINCTSLMTIYFNGNAPVSDSSAFTSDNNATAYYLPGTTGWDEFSSITGVPAALWLPEAQTTGVGFGVQTNQYGFNINWGSGKTVVVEACTNLSNPDWRPVRTNILTGGSAYFSDPQWTNYPGRFYRIRSP